jgi:hypothetical protein
VEGFSILTSHLISGASTVVLAVFLRGAPSWSASGSLSLYIFSSGVAIVSGSILYCDYCNPYLLYLIYTSRSKTGFPRGGFVQGHVDQKYCVYKCMLLALRSVHISA